MKSLRLTVLIAAFLLINFDSVLGCVCVPATVPQQIERAQTIFSGKVIGRTSLGIRFKVQNWWKGTSHLSEISLYADSKVITDCDVSLKIGETYLVYAFVSSPGNKLETNQCSGTKELKSAGDDLKILGKAKPPKRKLHRIRKGRSS
jgi:hypothetical protein